MFFYLLFLVIFTVILLTRRESKAGFLFRTAADYRFSNPDEVSYNNTRFVYRLIHDTETLWDWIEGPMVDAFSPNRWNESYGYRLVTNPSPMARDSLQLFWQHTALITNIRLTQKRRSPRSCAFTFSEGPLVDQYVASRKASALGASCYDELFNEDKAPFGLNNQYVWTEDPQNDINKWLIPPNPTYGSGGFSVEVPMPPRGGNASDWEYRARDQLHQLRTSDFIDEKTAALFIDFNLFNPSSEQWCIGRFFIEFHVSGGAETDITYRVHRFFQYQRGMDYFYLFLEILVYIGVFYYIAQEVRLFRAQGRKYFKEGWNWVNLINLVLFLTVLFIRIVCDASAGRLKSVLNSGVQYLNFQPLAYSFNQLNNVSAFNAVICYIKVFKYLGVSPQMSQITRVLARASKHILVFSIMFSIIYLGFATGFYVAFSTDTERYATVNDSLFALFRSLLGDNAFDELTQNNWFLGPLLFVLFVFLVMFVLINMFLAIINDAYAKIQEEVQDTKDPFAEELQAYFHDIKLKLKEIFRRLGNNKVHALPLVQQEVEKVNQIADKIESADKNNDSHVDAHELAHALDEKDYAVFGHHVPSGGDETHAAQAVVQRYDQDQDGKLNGEELQAMKQDMQRSAIEQSVEELMANQGYYQQHLALLNIQLNKALHLLTVMAMKQELLPSLSSATSTSPAESANANASGSAQASGANSNATGASAL